MQPLSESGQQFATGLCDAGESAKSRECTAETTQGSTPQATSPEAMQMGILPLIRQYIDYLEVFGLISSLQRLDLGRFTEFLDLSIVHPKAFE